MEEFPLLQQTPNFDKARANFLENLHRAATLPSSQSDVKGGGDLTTQYEAPITLLEESFQRLGFNVIIEDAFSFALREGKFDFTFQSNCLRFYEMLFLFGSSVTLVHSARRGISLRTEEVPETSFQWPLVEMAEFEFGSFLPNVDPSCVLVLTRLPTLCDPDDIRRMEALLRIMMARTVSGIRAIHFPLETSGGAPSDPETLRSGYQSMKGIAFIVFCDARDVSHAYQALNNFPWLLSDLTTVASYVLKHEHWNTFLKWKLWQARPFVEYGSQDDLEGAELMSLKASTLVCSAPMKRIHLHVPRTFDKTSHFPKAEGDGESSDSRTTKLPRKKSKSAFRNTTSMIPSQSRSISRGSINRSLEKKLNLMNQNLEAGVEQYEVMLNDASEQLSGILAKEVDKPRSPDANVDSELHVINGDGPKFSAFVRSELPLYSSGADEAGCMESLSEWCSSPVNNLEKGVTHIEDDIRHSTKHYSVDRAIYESASPISAYDEVVESLLYILTKNEVGKSLLDGVNEDRCCDMYESDLLDQLELRLRQKKAKQWASLESDLCAAMESNDAIAVLKAEIIQNELLEQLLEEEQPSTDHPVTVDSSGSDEDGDDDPSENEEKTSFQGTRKRLVLRHRRNYIKREKSEALPGTDKLSLKDLTHLLEATLDQLVEYSLLPMKRQGSGDCIPADRKADSCRKIMVLVSTVRSRIILGQVRLILRNNLTLRRSLTSKTAEGVELEKKLVNALDRVREYSHMVRELRDSANEMKETLNYHRSAAERVRLLERLIDDAEFDRRAAIAESERIQAQLGHEIGQLSRKLASVESQLSSERARRSDTSRSSEARGVAMSSNRSTDFSTSFRGVSDGIVSSSVPLRDVPPDDLLRYIESSVSVSDLSHMAEERLYKTASFVDSIASKVRNALDELKDRKIKELELKELERKAATPSEASLCCICKDNQKTILLLPCRHLCLCEHCANLPIVSSCPVCRAAISERLQVYSS